MGVAAVKIKIMPSSPDVDIENIKLDVGNILEPEGVKNPQFEVQPIAFGLKAIIVMFGWPEEKELEKLEDNLRGIDNVNSVELLDIRRAIG